MRVCVCVHLLNSFLSQTVIFFAVGVPYLCSQKSRRGNYSSSPVVQTHSPPPPVQQGGVVQQPAAVLMQPATFVKNDPNEPLVMGQNVVQPYPPSAPSAPHMTVSLV